MRRRLIPLFERLVNIGAAGLGHGQPFGPKAVEEAALRQVFGPLQGGDVTVFDVGANRGDYTALVLRNTRAGHRSIHAFEPDPAVAAQLRARFPDEPGLVVEPIALSDRPGSAPFYQNRRDTVSSLHDASDRPRTHGDQGLKGVIEVPLDTVDAYCAARNIGRIDLLKVDAEGHDHRVLQGAARMIREGRVGAIQFEFSEMNITSGATFMMFWERLSPGFTLYRMCRDGLHPVPRYHALLLELYYVVNFFAIAKER